MKREKDVETMTQIHKISIHTVLIGILILSLAVMPVTAARLTTPSQVAPANNQHFYHNGGGMVVAWKSVTGADRYVLEVEQNDGTGWTDTFTSPPNPVLAVSFGTAAGLDYRWRITAQDSTSTMEPSLPSAWRTFDVKIGIIKLATPLLLSPASGTILYNNPRMTLLAWKPSPGAANYRVQIEEYVTGTGWVSRFDNPIGPGIGTEYMYPAPSASQYRWRVTAQDPGGWYLNSDPSTWRTFTYTGIIKLATPQLLSPASGTNFYNNPRMTLLAWKPSPGTVTYRVQIEEFVTGTGWVSRIDTSVAPGIGAEYMYTAPSVSQYRWRITAQDPGGWYLNSDPSTWRTFIYKA